MWPFSGCCWSCEDLAPASTALQLSGVLQSSSYPSGPGPGLLQLNSSDDASIWDHRASGAVDLESRCQLGPSMTVLLPVRFTPQRTLSFF